MRERERKPELTCMNFKQEDEEQDEEERRQGSSSGA